MYTVGSSRSFVYNVTSLTFELLMCIASSGSERGHYSGIRMGTESLTYTGSRDPSAESMNSFMSTSTGNSMSPHATTKRPHSITSKFIIPGTILQRVAQ